MTVAELLSLNGILPPKEWLYYNNKPIKNINKIKNILK